MLLSALRWALKYSEFDQDSVSLPYITANSFSGHFFPQGNYKTETYFQPRLPGFPSVPFFQGIRSRWVTHMRMGTWGLRVRALWTTAPHEQPICTACIIKRLTNPPLMVVRLWTWGTREDGDEDCTRSGQAVCCLKTGGNLRASCEQF